MGTLAAVPGTEAGQRAGDGGAVGEEASAPGGSVPGRGRGTLPRVLLGALARSYLTWVLGLLVWAAAPACAGWATYVVQSGSMAPAVAAGDALIAAPVDAAIVRPGQILVVDDPAVPGRTLTHRLAELRPDGTLVTRGDANEGPDSTPVRPEGVRGLVRLRVPFVGLPGMWWRDGRHLLLAAAALGTAAAVALAATDPYRQPVRLPPLRLRSSRSRRRRQGDGGTAATGAACLLVLGGALVAQPAMPQSAHAAFRGSGGNATNSFGAAPDFVAPDASAVVAAKSSPAGYLTGAVRPSAGYVVYGAVTDTGNPASGVGSVTADVSTVTAGATAAPMNAATATVGGVAYNRASATLTAGATVGARTFSVSMTDLAGNGPRTRTGYSLTVDGAAPSGANVEAMNKVGGTLGRPEAGDTLTLTWNEPIDPFSVLANWTGAAQTVTVRFVKAAGGKNTVTVLNGPATLPLGTVTSGGYNGATTNLDFTGSTMTRSGTSVSVVLGTTTGTVTTVTALSALTWVPSATAYDAAGNPSGTATVTETGTSDANF